MTSRAGIAAAALELAREGGLEAVTIKQLAFRLGISPNTFYNYGVDKGAIRELMVRASLSSIAPVVDPDSTWAEQLHVSMMAVHDTLIRDRVLIELLMSDEPSIGPVLEEVRRDLVGLISGMPFTSAEAYELFNLLGSFLVGQVMLDGSAVGRADRWRVSAGGRRGTVSGTGAPDRTAWVLYSLIRDFTHLKRSIPGRKR